MAVRYPFGQQTSQYRPLSCSQPRHNSVNLRTKTLLLHLRQLRHQMATCTGAQTRRLVSELRQELERVLPRSECAETRSSRCTLLAYMWTQTVSSSGFFLVLLLTFTLFLAYRYTIYTCVYIYISSCSKTVRQLLECSSCSGFMSQPVCLPCGHSACRSCLDRPSEQAGSVVSCPQCNERHSKIPLGSSSPRKTTLLLQNLQQKWFPSVLECCRHREEGNRFAQEGDFPMAIECYNRAVTTGEMKCCAAEKVDPNLFLFLVY